MPRGRTSTAVAQANAVMRRHPDCSEGRRRLVARSPHGHKQPVRTTDATVRGPQAPRTYGRYLVALYNLRRPHQGLANRTPMAVWRDGVTGALGETAVDMMLRLDNAAALPTYPQSQQQPQLVLIQ